MKLFKRAKSAPTAKESLSQLRETLQKLFVYEIDLNAKLTRETINAKKYLSCKNKNAALKCLRQRKFYNKQIEGLWNSVNIIEEQINLIEGASMNIEIMKALKGGSETLKEMHTEKTIEEIEDVLDEVKEQIEISTQITEAISSFSEKDNINEDIMSELKEMEIELELENRSLSPEKIIDTSSEKSVIKSPVSETVNKREIIFV